MTEHLPTPEQDPLERRFGERTVAEWHDWLTGDDLLVPASRYGRRASDVAWWPIATLHAFSEFSDIDSSYEIFLEGEMSLAVNDADSVEEIVRDYLDSVPTEVLEQLRLNGEPFVESGDEQ